MFCSPESYMKSSDVAGLGFIGFLKVLLEVYNNLWDWVGSTISKSNTFLPSPEGLIVTVGEVEAFGKSDSSNCFVLRKD